MTLLFVMNLDFAWGESAAAPGGDADMLMLLGVS
jgi:hypothetical protein